jgi:hypothetical protein
MTAPRFVRAPSAQKPASEARTGARELVRALSQRPASGQGALEAALSAPGAPLPEREWREMETRFRRDFASICIHADPAAAEAARELGAEAFALGRRIVLDSSLMPLDAPKGRALGTHELTHVAQQAEAFAPEAAAIAPSESVHETEAAALRARSPYAALIQRKCACGGSAGSGDLCDEWEKHRLQLKGVDGPALTVAGDEARYEQEADHVAERVLGASTASGDAPQESAPLGIQRRRVDEGGGIGEVPAQVDTALSAPGRPLDLDVRAFFEPRFGHDFSRVRVHVDDAAAASVQAHAFTVGHRIVFAAHQYSPATAAGRRLLAHELTHVMQQGATMPRRPASALQRKAVPPYPGKILSLTEIAKDPEREKKRDATKQTEAKVCRSIGQSPTKANCPSTLSAGDKVTVTAEKVGGLWLQIKNEGVPNFGPKEPLNVLGAFVEAQDPANAAKAPAPQSALPRVLIDASQRSETPPVDFNEVFRQALKSGPGQSKESAALLERYGGKEAVDRLLAGQRKPETYTFDLSGAPDSARQQVEKLRTNLPLVVGPGADVQITPRIGLVPPGQERSIATVDPDPQQTRRYQALQSAPGAAALLSPYFAPGTDADSWKLTDQETALRASGIWKRIAGLAAEDRKSFDAASLGRMEGWEQFDKALTDFIASVEKAKAIARDQAEAASRAKKLIAECTTLGVLDKEKLGRELLAFATSSETQTVQATFDTLGSTSRDDVAAALVETASDTQLDALAATPAGKRLLSRIYDELTSGYLGDAEKHDAERVLLARSRAIDPKAFDRAFSDAMVIPFSGVGITKLSSASIDVTLLKNGKLRVKTFIKQEHWAKSRNLPKNFLLGLDSIEVDPDTVVGLYSYDEGGKVIYVPALYLLQLSNQEDTKLGMMAGEAAFTGFTLGLGGAASGTLIITEEGAEAAQLTGRALWLARGASAVKWADRAVTVLSIASRVITEHRGLIIEKFGEDGESFLRYWQVVDTVVAVYGLGRGAVALGQTLNGLRKSFKAWRETQARLKSLSAKEKAALDDVARRTEQSMQELEEARAAKDAQSARPAAGAQDEPAPPGAPPGAKAPNAPRPPSPSQPTTPGAGWTDDEVNEILGQSSEGRRILAVEKRHDIGVFPSRRNPTSFDQGTNIAHVGADMHPEQAASAKIHEVTHGDAYHQGLSANRVLAETPGKLTRPEYVEKMCREDARAVANEIEHKFEFQARTGRAYKHSPAAERAYSDAAAAESRRVLAAEPNADPAIVRMRSRIAGEEAVYREIMAGRVLTGEGKPYPAFYGEGYDAQPLPSFQLPEDLANPATPTAAPRPLAPAADAGEAAFKARMARTVEKAMRDARRNTIGAGGEAAAEASAHTTTINLNEVQENFPQLDTVSRDTVASVKAYGVGKPLNANVISRYDRELRRLRTPVEEGIPTKLGSAADLMAANRETIQAAGAWPKGLKRNATPEQIAKFVNEKGVLAIPADHVEKVREAVAAKARADPEAYGLTPGPGLDAGVKRLTERIQSLGLTTDEISAINKKVWGTP